MTPVKVVYNLCFGAFDLSEKAFIRLQELGLNCKTNYGWSFERISRHDPRLVQVVEELGNEANGACAKLAIKTLSDKHYRISEYDGREKVIEPDDYQEWITADE